jgi:hypothetical protein
MNDNKYLEKVALNALKARQMAKAVGVIPDHTSTWKYAVRNLRSGRGDALTGKALQEGRAKLGDVNHNTINKLKSISDKHGGSKGFEFSTRVNDSGRIESNVIKGQEHKLRRAGSSVNDNLHTHPGTSGSNPPNRVVEPSGKNLLQKYPNQAVIKRIPVVVKRHQNARLDESKYLKSNSPTPELTEKYNKAQDTISKTYDMAVYNPKSFLKADTNAMFRHHLEGNNKFMERIVSPDHRVVSANKFRGSGVRSVYFDHTPRKAKG